jgi:phosphohistidine phosphatase
MKEVTVMERQLLLMRHGTAVKDASIEDSLRPLKDKGKRGAQRMGVWLSQQQLEPDCIIASPAERALTTAEKTCKAMGRGSAGIIAEPRLYQVDDGSGILEVLANLPSSYRRVMLVGHNPSLQWVLRYLIAADDHNPPKLAPASLAQLQLPEDWPAMMPGCATLLNLVHARTLPKKFPFPGPQDAERRDRPAYYYSQSSVIPYRIREGQLEILIVGSSKMKHWVVPKGIAEPGLSPQDSAAKEANEEAGVEGVVDPEAIGSYRYEKWGAVCTVEVFPMQVRREIPETQWQESHRRREWVTAEQAAKRVRQTELVAIINALQQKLAAN